MSFDKLTRILFYVLATLLPVQSLIVYFLTNRLRLPEWLALWKELFVIVIILRLLWFIVSQIWSQFKLLESTQLFNYLYKNFKLLAFFILLNLVILLNSFVFNSVSLKVFVFGYRFEIFWLGFFVVIATWLNLSKKQTDLLGLKVHIFIKNLKLSVFAGFGLSSFISLCSIIFGQNTVLNFFGFGNQDIINNSGLVVQTVACSSADAGSDVCRLSGGFNSPNHFAGYLLLVLPIFIATFIRYLQKWHNYKLQKQDYFRFQKNNPLWILLLVSAAIVATVVFLLLTISRFAWLGLLVFVGLILIYLGHQLKAFKLFTSKVFLGILLFIPVFVGVLAINIDPQITSKYLPIGLAKPSSTIEHYRHTMASLEVLTTSGRYWQGFGLGSSGSVATPQYQDLTQNPIYKNYGYIALSWFLVPSRITIAENWYLSVLLNGGLLYFLLYLALALYPLWGYYNFFRSHKFGSLELANLIFVTGFFGVLVGNLFLHIWENQALAIYWSLCFILLKYANDNTSEVNLKSKA